MHALATLFLAACMVLPAAAVPITEPDPLQGHETEAPTTHSKIQRRTLKAVGLTNVLLPDNSVLSNKLELSLTPGGCTIAGKDVDNERSQCVCDGVAREATTKEDRTSRARGHGKDRQLGSARDLLMPGEAVDPSYDRNNFGPLGSAKDLLSPQKVASHRHGQSNLQTRSIQVSGRRCTSVVAFKPETAKSHASLAPILRVRWEEANPVVATDAGPQRMFMMVPQPPGPGDCGGQFQGQCEQISFGNIASEKKRTGWYLLGRPLNCDVSARTGLYHGPTQPGEVTTGCSWTFSPPFNN